MGTNYLIATATLHLPFFQHDTTTHSSKPAPFRRPWRAPLRRLLCAELSPRVFLGLFLLGGACARTPSSTSGKAHLQMQWNGSTSGSIEGPASAGWCPDRRVLQISLIQGDTGVALALYPDQELGNGVYRVVDPVRAESVPPAAGVAVRWLARTIVQGFQGDSGRVNLERSATGRLSGQVHARARSVVDTQRIRLSGTFRDLAVIQDTFGCGPADTTDDDAGMEATGVN
jgi:hypothetical protein